MGGVALFLLAPQTAPVLLAFSVFAPLCWCWGQKKRLPWHRPSVLFMACYVAAGYLTLNATWSLSPAWAGFAASMFLAFIAAVDVTLGALGENEADVLHAMAVGFVAGMIVGGTLVCFEVATGQWLRRLILPIEVLPDGEASYHINPSITALALTFWPAVLAIKALKSSGRTNTLLLLGLTPTLLAIAGAGHETSKMAILGSALICGLYVLRPALGRWVTIAGFATAALLVMPIAMMLFTQKLYAAPWLFPSAQHRIVIWGYTSEQVAKAPVFGVGINTARVLNEKTRQQAPRVPGTEFALGTGAHSHNGYLQTWYEAGALGVVLLLSIGLLTIRSFSAITPAAQPYLYACFVSCALVGASSFSLWQPWFMASFGLSAIFASLSVELCNKAKSENRE